MKHVHHRDERPEERHSDDWLSPFQRIKPSIALSRDPTAKGLDWLITRMMANNYWDLLRMERGGNRFVRLALADEEKLFAFLGLVATGFDPFSHSILLAFRQIEELVPNEEARKHARFFVEVEEGKRAVSSWYENVPHSELYHRIFASLSAGNPACDQVALERYLSALNIRQGGLARALVTVAFIEKSGLDVLQLLHDFVAQWQVLMGHRSASVDFTYLNEHMLHEGNKSSDQHVAILDGLLDLCKATDIQQEIERYDTVSGRWLDSIYAKALETLLES